MSSTPSELLDAARRVAAIAPATEACTRAVVSRAYYAALHGVAGVYPREDLAHNSRSHEVIIERAETHGRSLEPGRTEAAQAARELKKFKRMRKQADYDLDDAIPPEVAGRAIALGAAILGYCSIIEGKLAPTA